MSKLIFEKGELAQSEQRIQGEVIRVLGEKGSLGMLRSLIMHGDVPCHVKNILGYVQRLEVGMKFEFKVGRSRHMNEGFEALSITPVLPSRVRELYDSEVKCRGHVADVFKNGQSCLIQLIDEEENITLQGHVRHIAGNTSKGDGKKGHFTFHVGMYLEFRIGCAVRDYSGREFEAIQIELESWATNNSNSNGSGRSNSLFGRMTPASKGNSNGGTPITTPMNNGNSSSSSSVLNANAGMAGNPGRGNNGPNLMNTSMSTTFSSGNLMNPTNSMASTVSTNNNNRAPPPANSPPMQPTPATMSAPMNTVDEDQEEETEWPGSLKNLLSCTNDPCGSPLTHIKFVQSTNSASNNTGFDFHVSAPTISGYGSANNISKSLSAQSPHFTRRLSHLATSISAGPNSATSISAGPQVFREGSSASGVSSVKTTRLSIEREKLERDATRPTHAPPPPSSSLPSSLPLNSSEFGKLDGKDEPSTSRSQATVTTCAPEVTPASHSPSRSGTLTLPPPPSHNPMLPPSFGGFASYSAVTACNTTPASDTSRISSSLYHGGQFVPKEVSSSRDSKYGILREEDNRHLGDERDRVHVAEVETFMRQMEDLTSVYGIETSEILCNKKKKELLNRFSVVLFGA